eukprot:CAMPEP_0173458748 /NCGR_PEP_ID=MMETSP1357-20121228/60150_1 /TAXON_ID=77926 /ORGANISM="Hemiselmis rufescens, Strain PCC563" /LENGTH=164 /DNA_ID=CAMNT_0014426143 /DNA_START=70 /DNA_END=560 /DNA_ORIENTATION=+
MRNLLRHPLVIDSHRHPIVPADAQAVRQLLHRHPPRAAHARNVAQQQLPGRPEAEVVGVLVPHGGHGPVVELGGGLRAQPRPQRLGPDLAVDGLDPLLPHPGLAPARGALQELDLFLEARAEGLDAGDLDGDQGLQLAGGELPGDGEARGLAAGARAEDDGALG